MSTWPRPRCQREWRSRAVAARNGRSPTTAFLRPAAMAARPPLGRTPHPRYQRGKASIAVQAFPARIETQPDKPVRALVECAVQPAERLVAPAKSGMHQRDAIGSDEAPRRDEPDSREDGCRLADRKHLADTTTATRRRAAEMTPRFRRSAAGARGATAKDSLPHRRLVARASTCVISTDYDLGWSSGPLSGHKQPLTSASRPSKNCSAVPRKMSLPRP